MGATFKALGFAAAIMATGLAGCGKPAAPKADVMATDRASALCAAMDTAAEVKDLVFQQAAKQTPASNRLALAQLAKQATLRIESPLLDSYDDDTRKTTCSGQMHISLPAGAVRNLGDTSDLTASVKYSAQPTPDHLSTSYQVSGADDLISGIAGADISEWASRLQPNGMPAEGAPVPAVAGPLPPAATAPVMTPPSGPVPPPAQTRTARAYNPAPRGAVMAGNTPAAGLEPGANAAGPNAPGQGFRTLPRCAGARTYADRTICGDPALAAEDRRIANLYRNALAQDPTGEVRRVAQSERAAREGCQDRDCILEWFKQREADLSQR